jgi:hypothetical protein
MKIYINTVGGFVSDSFSILNQIEKIEYEKTIAGTIKCKFDLKKFRKVFCIVVKSHEWHKNKKRRYKNRR